MSQITKTRREEVLSEKGHECRFCGVTEAQHKEDHGRSLDIHHIIPKRQGGTDDVSNLLPVCIDCHRTLEETQGKALTRIRDEHTERLQDKIESLQDELVSRPDHETVESLIETIHDLARDRLSVDEVALALEDEYIIQHIVTKMLGRDVSTHSDAEKAFEEYEEWGGRLCRSRCYIDENDAEKLAEVVANELEARRR